MTPLIEVKNIFKSYDKDAKGVEVLKGVDLSILAQEALVIVGASGAGKSTLLHIMGTLDSPSSGEIFFKGENLFQIRERDLCHFRNQTMGFVFQFHHLLPMLNALENTMLPCMIAGWSKSLSCKAAVEILDQVGLSDRMRHRPSELSGGEQQRVAIARALVMKPEVLFADEPTGNLDSHMGDEIGELLLKMRQVFGMTLIVVTHNERLASCFARRVGLVDGKVKI